MDDQGPVSLIIGWEGPYSFDEASGLEGPGVYLVYGRNRRGAPPRFDKILYCGISDRDIGRRIWEHRDDPYNHSLNSWWIGRRVYPLEHRRAVLEDVEWMLVHFYSAEHNVRKKINPPPRKIYLINEWCFPDGRRRERKRDIATQISDVICWSPDSGTVYEANLKR